MEKKSIRMIAAVAAAAMLVPLAACGGGNAADGKTTLSFFSNNSQDKYQPIIDAFEKANPDIKIDYSTTTGSQSGYQQTLQTRISGGKPGRRLHRSSGGVERSGQRQLRQGPEQ